MKASIPARAAAANGASSTRRSRSRSWGTTGSSRWESVRVSPWPGKCLPQPTRPAPRSPRQKASACPETASGVVPNARLPITGFAGLVCTSSTGAKSHPTPSAASSSPSARPTAAVRTASPAAPTASIGGQTVAGARTRCTAPPS